MNNATKVQQLTIGSLLVCPSCHRHKRTPDSRHCGDCITVSRVFGRHCAEVKQLYRHWAMATFMGVEHLEPSPSLLADGDYKKFDGLGEFLHAYKCWDGGWR